MLIDCEAIIRISALPDAVRITREPVERRRPWPTGTRALAKAVAVMAAGATDMEAAEDMAAATGTDGDPGDMEEILVSATL